MWHRRKKNRKRVIWDNYETLLVLQNFTEGGLKEKETPLFSETPLSH